MHLRRMTKLLLLLLLISTTVWAQKVTTTELGGATNIYNDALKRYLILTSESRRPMYDTLFIQQDGSITDSLMNTINGIKVSIVDSSLMQEKLRRHKSFVLHRLFPLSFDKGVFYVSLVPFHVTETNGEVYLTNNGTFKVEYLFDSKLRAFRYRKGISYGY